MYNFYTIFLTYTNLKFVIDFWKKILSTWKTNQSYD